MPELQESEVGSEQIDLLALPSVPLPQRKKLPNCSAVYFVTDENWDVLYIGSCKSLVLRWLSHDKYERLIDLKAFRISWLETTERDLLEVERRYIFYFLPPLNSLIPAPRNTMKIRSIGGCLMVSFPQTIVRELNLKAGDEVIMDVEDYLITVKPVKPSGKGKGR